MFSISNALDVLGYSCEITSDRSTILSADAAVLPGVGAFPEAMRHIREMGLDDTIKDFIKSGKPFVGICLGFHLLFDNSSEFKSTTGLGILRGEVKNFNFQDKTISIPHVGWNNIKKSKNNEGSQGFHPLKNTMDEGFFYFVHSCYAVPHDDSDIYTMTEYGGQQFCSSILKDNIFACQFHPEKSGETGIKILNEMFK